MWQKSNKRSGYVSKLMDEINDIIDQAEDQEEIKAALKDLIPKKILESYKNGIKKAGSQSETE